MTKRILFLASIIVSSVLFMGCPKQKEDTVVPSNVLNTFTIDMQMAYFTTVNANPQCFIDLDKRAVYTIQTAPAHASEIDLVWHYVQDTVANDISGALYAPKFNASPPPSNGFTTVSLGIKAWNVRNTAFIEYSDGLDKTKFAAIKSISDLNTFLGGRSAVQEVEVFDENLPTIMDKVFMFKTAANKKGVFIVNSHSTASGTGPRANITIKLES